MPSMPVEDLVIQRPEGLYCPAGDFFIDPMRAVPRAVITHAHADHARAGHGAALAAQPGLGVLRARLGAQPMQGLAWGEAVDQGGVRVSLHPAGHVLGSAQVRLQHQGKVWVVSGDYFCSPWGDRNPTCEPFEPVPCDVFVTESTFASPLYRWRPQAEVLAQINQWWQANAADGVTSVVLAYSFGKAQRLLAGVDASIGPLLVHESVEHMNRACRAAGMRLPATPVLGPDTDPALLARSLVVMPPQAKACGPASAGPAATAFASGWMRVAKARTRRGSGRGFVLSDHSDWPGLLQAVAATGAERVVVHHGPTDTLVRWLQEQGLQAGTFAAARPGRTA